MIEFKSEQNIKQAWNKVKNWALLRKGEKWLPRSTSTIDVFHKRQVLEFYLNEEKRLDFLIKKIQCETFGPSKGDIYYQPKGNSGLRPMVVLSCDDLIFYQTIINVLVDLFADEFTALSDRFIYGNIPQSFDSDQVIKPYLNQYNLFVQQIKKKQNENFIIGESDISSFYEEISYSTLRNILKNKFEDSISAEDRLIDFLIESLGTWFNPTNNPVNRLKGIPQGVPQSHILANIFLFPLDQKMKREVEYIRYVDDFRIFASSELSISYGFLYLDKCLRELGLLKKESKTTISNKYEHDPFETFYYDIKDSAKIPREPRIAKLNFASMLLFNVSPGILDAFEWEELDKEELDSEEKIQDEIFSKIVNKKKDDEILSGEVDKEESFWGLSNIYSISEKELLEICEKHLVEALQNIYTDEELLLKYPKILGYRSIKSAKTINFNPLLIEQYSRLVGHIFKTVLVIKSKQINNAVCSDFTNYVAFQNCKYNPWELPLYSRYFQNVIRYQKFEKTQLDDTLDWLENELDYKNPFDTIKYYAFEILSSDVSLKKKAALSDNSLFYMKDNNVSWYLKVKAYETHLLINNLSANPTAVQSSLSHYTDSNNSCSSKLILAHEILNFHKISRLINVKDDVRIQELKSLIKLTIADECPTLNYLGYRISKSLQNEIIFNSKGKTYQEFNGTLSFDCFVRSKLEKNFNIHFPDTFSLKKIIEDNKSKTLQPEYDLIARLLHLSLQAESEAKWEVYINSFVGIIELLLFTLYSKFGLIDEKKNIYGFGYHKTILTKLFINDKFKWDELIDRIGAIRNKCLLSHIRDIKTAEFNPIVSIEIQEDFNNLIHQLIQEIIVSYNKEIDKDIINSVNEYLKKDKLNYQIFYEEVIDKLPGIEKQLNDIQSKLKSIIK